MSTRAGDARATLIALGAIFAAGAAVRLAFLSVPVRPDEAFTFLRYAVIPWDEAVSDYSLPNNHLLNTLAVHFSWRVFGHDEWTLRLPALLAGICTVPAVFLLGRELYGRHAGVWGAGLVAGSSALIQYSTNGRGYMAGTLFVVLAMASASWAARSHRGVAWAGFGTSAVLAVYSVPSMALGIVAVASWVAVEALAAGPRGSRLAAGRRTLRELAVTLVLVVAVGAALYAPTLGDAGWTPPVDIVPRAESSAEKWQLLRDIWGFYNEGLPFSVRLLILATALLAVVQHRRLSRHSVPVAPVAAIAAVPVLVVWDPPVFARNWIELLPLYLVTAGAGFALLTNAAVSRLRSGARAWRVSLGVAVVAAVATVLTFGLRGEDALVLDPPRGDPEVADFKRRALGAEQLVASRTGALAAAYYFRRDGVEGLTSGEAIPGYSEESVRVPPPGGRVTVLAINGEDEPGRVAAASGIQVRPGAAPALLRRHRYTSIYEVRAVR